MAYVLRLAFAGLSMDATKVLAQIAGLPYVKLAAAADSKRASALERFQADFDARVYGSIEELCKNPNVDAIYIATPPEMHTEHMLVAAKHRKHVIVEKPMALSIDDAEKMNEAADKYGI
jgi:phthalate 4,5-cis-dihydrodiol dehydrogenase